MPNSSSLRYEEEEASHETELNQTAVLGGAMSKKDADDLLAIAKEKRKAAQIQVRERDREIQKHKDGVDQKT